MTEEERKKTILELEQQVCKFPTKPENLKLDEPDEECEICQMKLINGECEAHPNYMRMHQRAMVGIRRNYEKDKTG
jgi:hypothetical protein